MWGWEGLCKLHTPASGFAKKAPQERHKPNCNSLIINPSIPHKHIPRTSPAKLRLCSMCLWDAQKKISTSQTSSSPFPEAIAIGCWCSVHCKKTAGQQVRGMGWRTSCIDYDRHKSCQRADKALSTELMQPSDRSNLALVYPDRARIRFWLTAGLLP